MQKSRIICVIDSTDINYALNLCNCVRGKVSAVKLGLEFFIANGMNGVKKVEEMGIPIFLDLKLHDIPNTVARTMRILKDLNITMLTVHIVGGIDMMNAIVDELSHTNIKIIGVTILTSLTKHDVISIGFSDKEMSDHVVNLTKLAQSCGLDGVVCSGHEIQKIRKICNQNFILVVPGIRISTDHHDQKRIISPIEAVNYGADYLVIGRMITNHSNPIEMIDKINHDINLSFDNR